MGKKFEQFTKETIYMANKLLNTREMQIKTTTQLLESQRVKVKRNMPSTYEDLQQLQLPRFASRNKKWYSLFRKLLDTFLYM